MHVSDSTPVIAVGEHPLEQFSFLLSEVENGTRCALVTIVGIVDTAARALGSHMVVTEDGRYAGSVSSGCVDGNVADLARKSLATGECTSVRLGAGSCFVDIMLPCGGGVDLSIVPDPDSTAIARVCDSLRARQPCGLSINRTSIQFIAGSQHESVTDTGSNVSWYQPNLQLCLAGRGAELVRFCEIGRACGYEVRTFSPDVLDVATCRDFGADSHHLTNPRLAPPLGADEWTAIVVLFHDHDWESGLLEAAVESDAFYIGALGSKKTHTTRLAMLRHHGIEESKLERIRGPIGIVPSMRNAPMLAISTLAEIIDNGPNRY